MILDISDLILKAGEDHIKVRNNSTTKKQGSKWYDRNCYEQRLLFSESQLNFLRTNSDEDRIKMSTERSKYRHICRVKKKEYNRNEASKLVTLSKSNSKQFWSIFNNKK